MEPFLAEVHRRLDELTSQRDETRELLRKLAVWLGENAADANPDALLKACAELIDAAVAALPAPPRSKRSRATWEGRR